MSDKEQGISLEQAIRSLHRSKYRKDPAWTDTFSEFKTYTEHKAARAAFFRIHQTPTDYRYSEDSHSRICAALSGHLINVEVERVEQDFEKTQFLLRSDHNYVSLKELIKIKRSSQQNVDMKFVLSILNFLTGIISKLVDQQINAELNISTVCFYNENIRLCDYNILFYPRNRRVETEGLREHYLQQASHIIFELLSCEHPLKMSNIYKIQIQNLLENLHDRDSSRFNDMFIAIVSKLLIDQIILEKQIKLLTQKVIYESGSVLTESNLTAKDERTQSAEYSRKLTRNSSMMTTMVKPALKPRRKRKIIFSIICLLLLLVGVGAIMFMFIFNQHTCKSNEYQDNHRCYPCFDGCKNCEGSLNNQCTKCWGSMWLVKLNNQQRTGSCESQCIGQEYEGRQCIVVPTDIDPYPTNSDIYIQ